MRLQFLRERSHAEDNQVLARIREPAVRMVLDNRVKYPSLWAAIESFAHKACARPGITTAEQDRVKALEREVKELRPADEMLKLASAFQVKLR